MRQMHETLLASVLDERNRFMSRRGLLTGGVKVGLGGALAVAVAGGPRLGGLSAFAQNATPETGGDFANDVEVLNYALTLEHLEYAFYRDGVGKYALGNDPFGNSINAMLTQIGNDEKTHVETLTKVINDLGGTPVDEATYDFGYTDAVSFRMTAAALENTGVSAYDGAGKYISNADLLTAAGGIVAVEARHASYLNLITGVIPFPSSFETPKTKEEVLAIAGPFITG